MEGSTMSQYCLKNFSRIELGSGAFWPPPLKNGIRLYSYEEIPTFLKGNPYITDGYRAYLPSSLCIKSLFILSNESINIWSHLLGFILFFLMGLHDTCFLLPSSNSTREDYIVFVIFVLCFQFCMLCSAGYHLFCCHHSEKTSQQWLALDYAGVTVGILGCYVPGVFYAFYCAEIFASRVGVMYLLASLAFFFYYCKIPERYWPGGLLNYIGCSHQWWHFLVVLMFYWWHQTVVQIMHYRHEKPCTLKHL
ncbi:progestin and adipoQ receptor family member 3-like isoform X5 [Protopterus annectens]|uniref:progestin and adipoQ receptor family member 3-like isoform X5 n=1 Tax=Protopterus annectens TaxID=7888 RepID=UPI001CFA4644|nr:progestin and adipoQ receptor family member 3-like isoform X5 [Protopterus annectens]